MKPTILIDTNIAIDLLRGNQVAQTWLGSQAGEQIGIAVITYFEVLKGARNRRQFAQFGRFLSTFTHVHLIHEDSQWAMTRFRRYWLIHQIDFADLFIAAVAHRRGLPLYTLNLKDFAPLLGVTAKRPYS